MTFEIGKYYSLTIDDKDPTFGLYKCIDIDKEGITYDTFFAAGRIGVGFKYLRWVEKDFWPNHIFKFMKDADNNLFYDVIKTIFQFEE